MPNVYVLEKFETTDLLLLDVFQEELNQNPKRRDPLISLTPIATDN